LALNFNYIEPYDCRVETTHFNDEDYNENELLKVDVYANIYEKNTMHNFGNLNLYVKCRDGNTLPTGGIRRQHNFSQNSNVDEITLLYGKGIISDGFSVVMECDSDAMPKYLGATVHLIPRRIRSTYSKRGSRA